nr:inactive protein RESTRICTED TEV MOVEMENT 2-like isoform X1 [Ipomoea batatas]
MKDFAAPAFERNAKKKAESFSFIFPSATHLSSHRFKGRNKGLAPRQEHVEDSRGALQLPATYGTASKKILAASRRLTWFQSGNPHHNNANQELVQHEVKETQKTPTTPPEGDFNPPPAGSQSPSHNFANTDEGHEETQTLPTTTELNKNFPSKVHLTNASNQKKKITTEDKAKQKE